SDRVGRGSSNRRAAADQTSVPHRQATDALSTPPPQAPADQQPKRSLLRWTSFLRSESSLPMEKRQLIEDIRRLNETATSRFLVQFDVEALRQYLEHLNEARTRPMRTSGPAKRANERVLV